MHRYLFETEMFGVAELLQQMVVALPTLSEPVVITDDHGMRVETRYKEIFDVFFGRHL